MTFHGMLLPLGLGPADDMIKSRRDGIFKRGYGVKIWAGCYCGFMRCDEQPHVMCLEFKCLIKFLTIKI